MCERIHVGCLNPINLFLFIEVSEVGEVGSLAECSNCGRKFASERLRVHMNVCTKQKTRKVFDMTKKRVEGTEAAAFVGKKGKPSKEVQV